MQQYSLVHHKVLGSLQGRGLPAEPERKGPDEEPAQLCRKHHRGCPWGSCRCIPPCCPTDLQRHKSPQQYNSPLWKERVELCYGARTAATRSECCVVLLPFSLLCNSLSVLHRETVYIYTYTGAVYIHTELWPSKNIGILLLGKLLSTWERFLHSLWWKSWNADISRTYEWITVLQSKILFFLSKGW